METQARLGRRRNRRPPYAERAAEALPGALVLLALFVAVGAAVRDPHLGLMLSAALSLYFAGHYASAGVAYVLGLRRVREWEAKDWQAEYDRLATPGSLPRTSVHHVVILPSYREPQAVLSRSLAALARQENAACQMTVVLAMEAADPDAEAMAHALLRAFEGQFAHLFYTVHPEGLPNEIQCKSANVAWAARWIKQVLVHRMGYDLDRILVTAMDADTLWHPHHFACLTTLFATHPDRYNRFWQGPMRYHNNVWDVHPIIALVHALSSAWELAYLTVPWWTALPMSSYALSLRLLAEVGYWDTDVIADEWHMFLKAFYQRRGRVRVERVLLPFSGEATAGRTLWEAIRNRYRQTVRHAWGVKEAGYAVSSAATYPRVRAHDTLMLLNRILHDSTLSSAGWVIMTITPQLSLLLYPALLTTALQIPALVLLQATLAVLSALTIGLWALDMRVRPPRPRPWTGREALTTLASFALLPVVGLALLVLPVIHAQMLLLLGWPLDFKVTMKAG